MTPSALALALAALQASPPATSGYDEVVNTKSMSEGIGIVVLCDPVRFRFSVRANADAASLDRSYPRRTVIESAALTEILPGWTGRPEIRAYFVRYERCGPYTIKLSGDAYNVNIMGESGAYPEFAAVTVIRGNSVIHPQEGDAVRLTECDRKLARATPCPTGYAVRIDGTYDSSRKMLNITETSSSLEDDDLATRRIATRRVAIEDDLTLWSALED